jgi:AraC-like DNA-binding protein
MIFDDIYPTSPLDKIIQLYRLRHFVIPKQLIISSKPYPPRPENCIAFYPRGFELTQDNEGSVKRSRSVISGQYTHLINRRSSPDEFLMILVVFKPGALHRITGIPFYELNDTHIDLESVYPKEGSRVNERLSSCSSYSEMIIVIERFLLDIYNNSRVGCKPFDPVFDLILSAENKYPLQYLANQACLSPRQFERKAYQYLGVSPRFFSRIVRFNKSYEMRLKNPGLDWLSIAVACNYHDYQHLSKDYKELTNATPNKLFAAESKVLERSLGLQK